MKQQLFISIAIALMLSACGNSSSSVDPVDPPSPGSIAISCMNITAQSQCINSPVSLTSTTSTFDAGVISLNSDSLSTLTFQGTVVNNTPNAIQGFWYGLQSDQEPGGCYYAWPWIKAGGTYNLLMGGTLLGNHPLGQFTMTAWFFDVTNDPSAPTPDPGDNNCADFAAYLATHQPAAVGVLTYQIAE